MSEVGQIDAMFLLRLRKQRKLLTGWLLRCHRSRADFDVIEKEYSWDCSC
jgi:hypothetical protein